MRTRITSITTLFLGLICVAQNGINYKAIVKDGSGDLVVNELIALQFQILQGVAMTNVYQETHTPTTDANGIVVVNIGEGISGDVFTAIDWGATQHYLNVKIDTGDGLTDMGTTQFKTVPYALTSSDSYWSKNSNSIYTLEGDVGINSMNPEHTLDVRATAIDDPASLNVSNQDKSRYLRLFSGSSLFPDPSFTWAPGRNLLFAHFDDNTLAFSEYMRISSMGDVGIGISDPQAKLDILGGDWNLDGGNPGDLRIGNTTNNFRIGIATGGGGAGITRMYTNSNALILGTNDTPALILEGNGVLIAPALTNTLINDGGSKALVTKEYVESYSPVKTITVSASAFNPSSNSSTFRINSGTKAYCTSSNTFLYAPITLPAGTIINEITAYTFDSDASNDLDFAVGYAFNMGGQTPSLIFNMTTTGSSGLQVLPYLTNFTIFENNQYFIMIRPVSGDTWNGSNLSIAQVKIRYTE